MELRPNLQIPAMIKALTEVVLPSIDPVDKVALEQGQLVVAMLHLMARQIPLQYRFDCDELCRLITFARSIESATANNGRAVDVSERLAAHTRAAAELLEKAGAEPDQIFQAINHLRDVTSKAVQAVFDSGDEADRARTVRATLEMSNEQILRDRAWLISQGWETDPESLPRIETLLVENEGVSA